MAIPLSLWLNMWTVSSSCYVIWKEIVWTYLNLYLACVFFSSLSLSIVSFDDCKLQKLGKVADETGGIVSRSYGPWELRGTISCCIIEL